MSKLQAIKIGGATYFCNDEQIKEAGSLEKAAQKMHNELNREPKPPKGKKENGSDSGKNAVTE